MAFCTKAWIRPPLHRLEADTSVVWTLLTLYGTALGSHHVFRKRHFPLETYNAI